MFLEIEDAERRPHPQLLEWRSHADPELGIDQETTHECGAEEKDDDGVRVRCCGHGAEASYEGARGLARRPPDTGGLMRDRPQQRHRQQAVDDQEKRKHEVRSPFCDPRNRMHLSARAGKPHSGWIYAARARGLNSRAGRGARTAKPRSTGEKQPCASWFSVWCCSCCTVALATRLSKRRSVRVR